MGRIIIQGGERLTGDVPISGAKNAALPILASSLLTEERCTFYNVPDLVDVHTIGKLLAGLGAEIEKDEESFRIQARKIENCEASYDLVKTMRASILVLGPLLARTGKARVSLPGGCAIGARPVNLHLKALRAMGADIDLHDGYVVATTKGLTGATIFFDTSTVTGTENIMMAATLARGTTVLENAAKEPEVENLARVLNGMGARVRGAGTDVITIEGVSLLHGVEDRIIADRVEAGTFMIAAAITGGDVLLKGCEPKHLEALMAKLREAGVTIETGEDEARVSVRRSIESVDLTTLPYPGFPTDLQAQMMALMSVGNGISVIRETVFENRFMHVNELMRMGADIVIDNNQAIVSGVERLRGAPVMATDLRASASLVLAGLVAEGKTELSRVYHIDRGYERIEKKLSRLGANIRRVRE
ncbi:MAG: UDP-N-acetylglucosamine 1-carboxyvinyltransferase [Syntrophales bacterium]|jgi:UDP-N-acetylglucosamine 1-carboxyvinyltransferase|nr:UDP-N-acetylglucosamine 1-carboxyvinyltransferase [Syntrophales bacterium]MCK9527523.1 UDP-N-acetylglucosamine 1-carboxyvinyltransferase [Syntrophales bacterium]MDX9922580.1 UDP-N-acetylglucosamine 1-carboxyvinyltransferase [Syntrophales bacterium]